MADVVTISRGKKAVTINDKDLEYLARLVRSDVRYLLGRSAKRRGQGDANAKKLSKRGELMGKLDSLRRTR